MFQYEIVKNPLIFQENRLPAHGEFLAMQGKEGNNQLENPRFSLDGNWKFAYGKNYELAPKGFEALDWDCKSWDDILVPGHIQLQGYDLPQYTNVAYPWDGKENVKRGEVPVAFNPTGSYVKYFFLPENWVGKQIRISFQGVESGAALWCNGHYVGYFENSFDPADFDLTAVVVPGENKLAVQVFKWTAGSWCEDQDFFRFSGIYRSVYLYQVPNVHLEDYTVKTYLTEDYRKARLELEVVTCAPAQIHAVLRDGEKIVQEVKEWINGKKKLSISDLEPKLWSAEHPYLYDFEITVQDEATKEYEVIVQKVGFRQFQMINNIMCINGKRIVFHGVNRHEFSSLTGRSVSTEDIVSDIIKMKQNNINAIRTSHYPDDVKIYDLCDQFGLYLIAENNLETHGTWPIDDSKKALEEVIPGDNEIWKPLLLDRINSCYQRDKNHPCILIWSCGNESYGGTVIRDMADQFRELDDTRLVHYEGVSFDPRYLETTDMVSQMYSSVESIRKHLHKDSSKPFIVCEYTHAMGNSCGAMHKYTDLEEEMSSYQGGFIWDFVDQSITKKNRYGEEFQAYGGDFKDRPCDYNFSGNGIIYGGDRSLSPKMQEVKYNYQTIKMKVNETEISIRNLNLFTCTCEYTCKVSLYKEGVFVKEEELKTAVEPLSTGSYPLPFKLPKDDDEYYVLVSFQEKEDTLWCKMGHEVAFSDFVLTPEKLDTDREEKSQLPDIELIQGLQSVGVKGLDFEVLFSRLYGGLTSYKYAGLEMITAIPKPNFWRAPTDNDWGCLMPFEYAQWKGASLYLTHKSIDHWQLTQPEVTTQEDSYTFTYHYRVPTIKESSCTVAYQVFKDGRIQVTMEYDPVKGNIDMPEFGMMYVLDADFDHIKWYGYGPEETYEDRCKGAKLGIYQNKVVDNLAKYLVPQECGNKVGVRVGEITDAKGRGLRFTSAAMNFSALPYTPHELESAMHAYELPPIHHSVIRVSKMQMGIGGDDSWGAKVHPEYHLDVTKKIVFSYDFIGIY